MANLKDLEKYLNYEFSSGSYTGEDYKIWKKVYKLLERYIQKWRLGTCKSE